MFRKLTLADMAHDTSIFTTLYASLESDDYSFTYKTGHQVVITKFFGPHPYTITLHTPSDSAADGGSAAGFDSAEAALEYYNALVESDHISRTIGFTRADHDLEFCN